ncbi:hypothetical protein HK102_007837 [Quaeritorhiza haematococci]|nr:hypothetical protein HK102_007837 [Quaeritorhiza haematococci]
MQSEPTATAPVTDPASNSTSSPPNSAVPSAENLPDESTLLQPETPNASTGNDSSSTSRLDCTVPDDNNLPTPPPAVQRQLDNPALPSSSSVNVEMPKKRGGARDDLVVSKAQSDFIETVKAAAKQLMDQHQEVPFWFEPPNSAFDYPKKDAFTVKKVFVWVPEFQFPKMYPNNNLPASPTCDPKARAKVTREAWSRPRRVVMDDQCCYILCYRYKCEHSSHQKPGSGKDQTSEEGEILAGKTRTPASFATWDDRFLATAPLVVRNQFPFILTARSGILRSLALRLVDDVVSGKSIQAVRDCLYQSHINRFHDVELQYYSVISYFRDFWKMDDDDLPEMNATGMVATHASTNRTTTHISNFFLNSDKIKDVKERIRNPTPFGGFRDPDGIYTIFNEAEQVLWQKVMYTKSLKALAEELKLLLLRRFVAYGFPLPKVFYTDECCDDRSMLSQIVDELRQEGIVLEFPTGDHSGSSASTDMEKFDFLDDTSGVAVSKADDISASVASLRRAATDGVLGFDIEWDVDFVDGTQSKPATVQLSASDGTTFLFNLPINPTAKKKNDFPHVLKELLEDESLTFVGVGVKGDRTRMENGWKVKMTSVVDVAEFALRRKVPIYGRSLASLVETFFNKRLEKPYHLRFSRWSSSNLTKQQIHYACLDAYASIKAYNYVLANSDAFWDDIPTNCQVGDRVLLYSKNSAECLAEGQIGEWKHGGRWKEET